MSLFRKKKNKAPEEQAKFLDPDFDIDAEFRKARKKSDADAAFERIEVLQYVRTQCQVIEESSAYVGELKTEYQAVNNYISDVRIIESQSKSTAGLLKGAANDILRIENGREKMRNTKSKLSKTQQGVMERYKDEFPKALVEFQNDEKYADTVKRDMKILEAEKAALKEDMENYINNRLNVRNLSVISLLALVAVFGIFIGTGQLDSNKGKFIFMIILALAAVLVLLIFAVLRHMAYGYALAEKKNARAITLLNKTKIKYVNAVNSVDYRREKFRVKNAYELSKIYSIYLEEEKRDEKYKASAAKLEEAYADFDKIIKSLNLYDSTVWAAQLDAIVDDKAMKALHNGLNSRKQNLRDRIDYNMTRMEESKASIMKLVKKHPDMAQDIMQIVDSYDND